MQRRLHPWVSLIVVLVVVAAACSSSKKESSGGGSSNSEGGTAPTTRTTTGVTDTSIKVAGLATLSGSILSFNGVDVGAKARFKRANDAGGVNGRKIDFVEMQDDKSLVDENTSGAKKLVQEDQVFAVLPVMTAQFGGSDFLTQSKVPYFGWGIAAGFCGNRYGFGFTGCVNSPKGTSTNVWSKLLAQKLGGAKGKTVALIAEDADSAKAGLEIIKSGALGAGFTVVYSKGTIPSPPAVVPDYSPFANELLSSNGGKAPDAIFMVLAPGNVFGLTGQLKKSGFKGAITNPVTYDPRLAMNSDVQGSLVYLQFAAYELADSTPAIQQLIADVKAADPNQQLTLPVAAGYWIADFFLSAVEKTGKDLTRESFLQTLNGGSFTYEAPGAVGKSVWPLDHDLPVPCGSMVLLENQKYAPTAPFECDQVVDENGKVVSAK